MVVIALWPLDARAMPHNPGNSKSQIPIGRSMRIRCAKGLIFSGRILSTQIRCLISVCSSVFITFVMTDHIYKYPRLFINAPLKENGFVSLEQYHAHYLKNVLRKVGGDYVRLFNGVDGEWLAVIQELGKKSGQAALEKRTRMQPDDVAEVELWFSPIKKQNMDFLIEKSVELGVSAFRPVIMNRTENRKINMDRINTHITEASEQCERLDIPTLHAPEKITDIMRQADVPVYVAFERCDQAVPISVCDFASRVAFLIGPEGGFDDSERALIQSYDHVRGISLGQRILRAETAAVSCLSYAYFSTLSK